MVPSTPTVTVAPGGTENWPHSYPLAISRPSVPVASCWSTTGLGGLGGADGIPGADRADGDDGGAGLRIAMHAPRIIDAAIVTPIARVVRCVRVIVSPTDCVHDCAQQASLPIGTRG